MIADKIKIVLIKAVRVQYKNKDTESLRSDMLFSIDELDEENGWKVRNVTDGIVMEKRDETMAYFYPFSSILFTETTYKELEKK